MAALMHYMSHAWYDGRRGCEVYVGLAEGKPPGAGETLMVETFEGKLPLIIQGARWQDEQAGGVLVLNVAPDQAEVIDKLYMGVAVRGS